MSFLAIHAGSVAPQPWRNGGGQTRELLVWPSSDDWCVRISRADIEADGPFSAFPQVQRWFTVLRGAGVALSFSDRTHEVRLGDAPLQFEGAAAPGCRLLDGPTQDLNLMLRRASGVLRIAQPGIRWQETFALRALYTTAAGVWHGADRSLQVAADTLIWDAETAPGAWMFSPQGTPDAPCAWWLGCTPEV